MAEHRGPGPSTAEETERTNRQPGSKGHPHTPGPTPESPDEQPEKELKPSHRRKPSGLLDVDHRPGPQDRPEGKP